MRPHLNVQLNLQEFNDAGKTEERFSAISSNALACRRPGDGEGIRREVIRFSSTIVF